MDSVRATLKLPANGAPDGSGVLVAVLDTGVDREHPDLAGRVVSGSLSLAELDSRLIDEVGHGTHVAGIIAGTGEASNGRFRGVAPGADLLVFRVGTDHITTSDTVADGVLRAVDAGADIINYSAGAMRCAGAPPPWVWSKERRALDRAFLHATEQGVLCVAAAGNEGPSPGSVVPPSIYPEILSVGSTGPDGIIAEGSSRGPVYLDQRLPKGKCTRYDGLLPGTAGLAPYAKPDLVAPGGHFRQIEPHPHHVALRCLGISTTGVVSCRSTLGRYHGLPKERTTSPYTRIPGTSMACAIVSGMAALVIQLAKHHGLDWGNDRARALRNLFAGAARRPPNGHVDDYGSGTPLWPTVSALLEDCLLDNVRRRTILDGPQLELLRDSSDPDAST